MTGRARLRGRHRERHLGATDRLVEAQRHLGLEVAAPRLTRLAAAHATLSTAAAGATPPTEQVRDDVAEAAAERARVKAAGEVAERSRAAVIRLALVGVRQDVVRLRDPLEALLRLLVALVAVRVILARELAVGLLDLLVGGVLADPQLLVVVGPFSHLRSPSSPRRSPARGAGCSRPVGSRAGRPRPRSLARRLRTAAARPPRGTAGQTARPRASRARSRPA